MRIARLGPAVTVLALLCPALLAAQQKPTQPGWPQPVADDRPFAFALLDQNELRAGPGPSTYRWEGEGWYGGNLHRLWVRTEGSLPTGLRQLDDAEAQALYSRAVTPFFDLQAGVRYDFRPSRPWLAAGVEGLAPLFFEVGAFVFVSTEGRYAGRLEGSYDMLLTQRLVLQPRAELNLYARREPVIGRGRSELDAGLRLRYDVRREVGPYVGLVYGSGIGSLWTAGLRLWR